MESTNKTVKGILRKIVNTHWTDWDCKLQSASWAYRTSFKTSIGATPFRLAYGLEAVIPVAFEVPSLRIQVQEHLPEHASQLIKAQKLLELDGKKMDSERHIKHDQLFGKAFVDPAVWEGSPVLVFSSRSGLMLGKLKLRWSGPFWITKEHAGAFQLNTLDGQVLSAWVNGC